MITYRAEILDEVERRRLDLSVGLLRVYNYYRVLVGLGLLAAASQSVIGTRFGQLDLGAFYLVASAYTLIKDPDKIDFSYRDNLFMGSDLLATGIASFGHISGIHYQNKADMNEYKADLLERGQLPLGRAMKPTPRQLLIREMILLLKKGQLDRQYFRDKHGVDIVEEWPNEWQQHVDDGYAVIHDDRVELTREGLLRVDGLLPVFFEPGHQGIRYT